MAWMRLLPMLLIRQSALALGLGVLVLAAFGCGGHEHDSLTEPATVDPAAATADPAAAAVPERTPPLLAIDTSDPEEACLGSTGLDRTVFGSYCRTCLAGAVPRCINSPVPMPNVEPAACAAADCQIAIGMTPRNFSPALLSSGGAKVFRGACADGKTFEAAFTALDGQVDYSRDGKRVGRATYTAIIGDCACSGETWSADVVCASPKFETEPAGEVRLPFADGRTAAPCMCAE